jgi:hypothetical protein
VNYLGFDHHLIRQRNEEMLREVRALRLGGKLRKNSRACSERSHTHNLTRRSVLSWLRGVASSE